MLIKIYGKDDCPFCNQALELAQRISASTETVPGEATIKWQYLKLGQTFSREELFEKFPTGSLKLLFSTIVPFKATTSPVLGCAMSLINLNFPGISLVSDKNHFELFKSKSSVMVSSSISSICFSDIPVCSLSKKRAAA